MNKEIILIIGGLLFAVSVFSQTYPNNEEGQFEDMLTPEYYNTPDGGTFRLELNKFVHFARQIPFQIPLMDSSGQIPSYTIRRSFGDGLGPGGTSSHHPAFDYYIGGSATTVNLYAAFDGYVTINKNADRYRQYLSITTDIRDSSEMMIGKMVALYGHVDLDLDSADHLELDGQYVKKGDLLSKHLYSETVGGPHLHFEIRYYRSTDTSTEDFYGGPFGGKTAPSTGSWNYGFWNPNVGYGFAHPENHINNLASGIIHDDFEKKLKFYPNPVTSILTIEMNAEVHELSYSVYSLSGQVIENSSSGLSKLLKVDMSHLESGFYIIVIKEDNSDKTVSIGVIKE